MIGLFIEMLFSLEGFGEEIYMEVLGVILVESGFCDDIVLK